IAEQLEGRLHRLWTTPRKLAGLVGLLVSVALTVSLTLGGLSLGSVAWMVNFLLFTIALSLVLRRDAARLALSASTVLRGVLGVALLLAGGVLGFGRARVRLLPMLLGVALVALAVMVSLAERGAVGDSAGSNSVRYRALETGLYLPGRTDAFGSGPGLAYQVK